MKRATTRTAWKAREWRFAIWVLLAAFTLQAYVTQTHFHNNASTVISKVIVDASDDKTPLDNSQPDCPFCQAVAQASAFHLPGSPLLILTSAYVLLAAPSHPAPASYDTAAHIWRSRAPPQQ
jgi:hypothetical protein